jgi:hypothetical protein
MTKELAYQEERMKGCHNGHNTYAAFWQRIVFKDWSGWGNNIKIIFEK